MILLIGGQHGSRALCSGEAGVAASEHWLSRSHGIQRMPTVNLNWETDDFTKSEGANPSGTLMLERFS